MTIETYLANLLATVIVLVIPGPTIMLVASCSLPQGKRAALPLALGVELVTAALRRQSPAKPHPKDDGLPRPLGACSLTFNPKEIYRGPDHSLP